MASIKIFEFLHFNQEIPKGLLGPTKRHFEKIKKGELIDNGKFIFTEVLSTDESPSIKGRMNDQLLKFHKVLGTLSLHKATIESSDLIINNNVEIEVSVIEDGRNHSEKISYQFNLQIDDLGFN